MCGSVKQGLPNHKDLLVSEKCTPLKVISASFLGQKAFPFLPSPVPVSARSTAQRRANEEGPARKRKISFRSDNFGGEEDLHARKHIGRVIGL